MQTTLEEMEYLIWPVYAYNYPFLKYMANCPNCVHQVKLHVCTPNLLWGVLLQLKELN